MPIQPEVKTVDQPKLLLPGDSIPYTDVTVQYGRAEFDFCIVAKRGKLVEVHIQRRQQLDHEHDWYVYDLTGVESVAFKWRGENVTPWRYAACKRHGLGISIYVPDGTDRIAIRQSSVQTRIEFLDRGARP